VFSTGVRHRANNFKRSLGAEIENHIGFRVVAENQVRNIRWGSLIRGGPNFHANVALPVHLD